MVATDELKRTLSWGDSALEDCVRSLLYRRNKIRLGRVFFSLAEIMYAKAIGAYFIDGNINEFKQHCYIASRAYMESVSYDGGASFSNAHEMLVVLFSDCQDNIKKFAHLNNPDLERYRIDPRTGQAHVYLVQLAIRREYDEIREYLKVAASKKAGRSRQVQDLHNFFYLLVERDKDGLERLIQDKHANIKSTHPNEEMFLSFLGCLETKLCWFNDIPVEIDHSLVPMDLMPIRPLEKYDNVFEFFEPGWVAPRQGFIANTWRRVMGRS